MAKEIYFEAEMKEKILAGIEKVADTIGRTLGPAGRNTALYKKAELRDAEWSDSAVRTSIGIVINDGATIAKSLVLEDPVENIGAQIIREAAEKTNNLAGDGTTTTTVLTREIVREGFRMVMAGANPILLKKALTETSLLVESQLDQMSEPVETEDKLAMVASISAGDAEIGEAVGKALYEGGLEGVINIDDMEARDKTRVRIDEGIVLNRGFVNSLMAEDQTKIQSELYDPYIFITDYKIENTRQILDLLIEVAETDKPLLIIAEELETEVVATILKNKMEGDLKIVAIHPPLYGEGRTWRMEDLAVQTGASFISKTLGRPLTDVHLADLGSAGYVRITKNETVIMDAKGDPEEVRVRENYLRSLVQNTDYDFNKKRHQERLASFVSGIATVIPGGGSRVEIEEKKFKIEDAINAARSARMEGIVPGGGTAYIDCIPVLESCLVERKNRLGNTKAGKKHVYEEDLFAAQILIKALKAPLFQIAENAGLDGNTVINKVMETEPGTGFNAEKLSYENMKKAGIIDPLMVSKFAFRSAVSIAATFLSSSAAVTETKPNPVS